MLRQCFFTTLFLLFHQAPFFAMSFQEAAVRATTDVLTQAYIGLVAVSTTQIMQQQEQPKELFPRPFIRPDNHFLKQRERIFCTILTSDHQYVPITMAEQQILDPALLTGVDNAPQDVHRIVYNTDSKKAYSIETEVRRFDPVQIPDANYANEITIGTKAAYELFKACALYIKVIDDDENPLFDRRVTHRTEKDDQRDILQVLVDASQDDFDQFCEFVKCAGIKSLQQYIWKAKLLRAE